MGEEEEEGLVMPFYLEVRVVNIDLDGLLRMRGVIILEGRDSIVVIHQRGVVTIKPSGDGWLVEFHGDVYELVRSTSFYLGDVLSAGVRYPIERLESIKIGQAGV